MMQWAIGLTITTTGLDKFDKEAIRQDVEAAGGRYSPNLSKRTTHLVTPEVVSNPTEKLTAAAGGQGQQRFKALQVVSKCWVSASAGLRCRACETQFAPLLPPPSAAASTVVRHDSSSTAAGHHLAGHTTPQAASAGPQAPWVVHFSQLPDDSVYGAQEQQHESPSAVRQLAQQLHMQLSPISEAFSQEQCAAAQMQPSPEWHSAGRVQAKRQREEATSVRPAAPPAGSPGEMLQQQLHISAGSSSSPWQQGGHSSDTTPAAVPLQQTWQLSTGCERHTPLQQQPEQQQQGQWAAAACTSAGGANSAVHDAEAGVVSPKSRVRPPLLKLPLGINSTNASSGQGVADALRAPANSSTGWGHAATHLAAQQGTYMASAHLNIPQQQQQQQTKQQQQQPQQGMNNQEPWAPDGPALRGLKRVSTQGYSSLGAAAAEAEASAERERRSTAESLQQHRELLQQQLQLTKQNLQQQQQPDWLQQQQQQHGETQPTASGNASGSSNVSELIAALQRVTNDSRRATAETGYTTHTAAAAAGITGTSPPSSYSLHRLGTSGNLSARFDAAADTAVGAQPSDGGEKAANKSSIESLLQSLRGLSDKTAPQAPSVQPLAEGWTAGPRAAGPLPLLGVMPNPQQQASFGTGGAAPQPGGSTRATNVPKEQQPQQQGQQPEALYWGSAGGHSSTAHTVPGSSYPSTGGATAAAVAAQSSSQGPPSPLDLDQLLSMLHRATGDSRRGTTETAARSSSGVVGGNSAGGSGLQSILQDSRRATAEAAVVGDPANINSSSYAGRAVHAAAAPAGVHVASAVAEAAAVPLPLSQDAAPVAAAAAGQAAPQLPQWAVNYGWGSGVAAPEQHRALSPDGMRLAGSHGGAPSHPKEQQHQPLQRQGTGVSQPHAELQQQHAGSAGGSGSSVADLIAALRRATGESRRNTWEAAPAAATAPSAAAAADSDDAAAGGVDVDPSRRNAGRPHKPHLSLKLPSDSTAFDAKAQSLGQGQDPAGVMQQQTQLTEHARVTPNAEQPDSRTGSSGGSAHAYNSSNVNGSSGVEGPEGIDGLLNALQCIAVANKLQEAAAMAPEVAVVAQCHVAALERQVDQMPGSEYAALVSKLSLELSELNKQGLQDLQQQQQQGPQQGSQQQQLGPEYSHQGIAGAAWQASVHGAAADAAAATAGAVVGSGTSAGQAAGPDGDMFGSMSSGSQGLQQLVAALRMVTAEKEAADSSSSAGSAPHAAPTGSDRQHPAEQPLLETHAQVHAQHGLQHQQVLQVSGACGTGMPGSVQEAPAVQAAPAEGNGGNGSCSTIEALLSALQATSNRQAHNSAATGAGSPEPAAVAASSNGQQHKAPAQQLSGREQAQQQQLWSHAHDAEQHVRDSRVPAGPSSSSNGTSVQDLLVALRRATESKRWEGAEAVPEPAIEPAIEPHHCSSSDGEKDSSSGGVEQQTEQPGWTPAGDAGCETGAGVTAAVLVASAPVDNQQRLGAAPRAGVAGSPPTVACASPVAADASPAAQPMQQSQEADAAQQPCLPGPHSSVGDAGKHCVGSRPAGVPDFAAMSVVFDSHVPQATKAQLSEALAAQGATVLTGQPHLGCGANTVVAEPEGAGTLLPLLLDIVSPAWLAKALRRQQGQGQVMQQAVAVSPDVARAIGLQLQHSAAHTAGMAAGSFRQTLGSTGAAAGSGKGLDDRSGSSSAMEQVQQPQVPVLVVPHGYAVTCAGDSMPVVLEEVESKCQHQQQQSAMMPAVLLTDQLWSVGQQPRMVAEEELDAVVLPAWCSSTITLLLPQCSSSLLGHAAITCPASDPSKGLTCGDVLAAVHDFYQQDVLLQLESQAQAGAAVNPGLTAGRSGTAGDGSAEHCAAQSGSQEAGGVGLGSQVVGQKCEHTGSQAPGCVQVVKRLQLLGHKQMFEGLVRVTRDPCSSVYEVCLA